MFSRNGKPVKFVGSVSSAKKFSLKKKKSGSRRNNWENLRINWED